ncbi:MAG TPA: VWA domain-containing protein [Pyrinomonadaceae bacterium]|nr:VWA domain-containing protein [Pyrinomonadaceae bacterium]
MKRLTGLRSFAVLLLTLASFSSAFAQSEKKAVYGLLLDNTGSLETQFSQIKVVGKKVVMHARQRGLISLFDFMTKRDGKNLLAVAKPGVEWSRDENVLNDYIDGIQAVQGHTALIEAIQVMAKELNAKADTDKESFGDKIIILITDGEDRIRWAKSVVRSRVDDDDARRKVERQLVKSLKESAVKVYAVGFTSELDADGGLMRKSDRETAETFLKKITKETGGRAVFFKPGKTDIESVLNELLTR